MIPSFAELSPDGKLLALLDEYGEMTIHDAVKGTLRARFTVPERGKVLRFSPDSKKVLLGSFRGSILAYDLDGKLLWQTVLGEQNDILGRELPLYDPAIPDHTEKLWPVSRDQAGDLDKLVRLDANRLGPDWKGQKGEPGASATGGTHTPPVADALGSPFCIFSFLPRSQI